MKICFKCNRNLDLGHFYKHSQMKDGHLNKCKECTKKDVDKHRQENLESISIYEASRNKTESRRKMKGEYQKIYRQRYPEKYKARQKLGNAVRDGRVIKPKTCTNCNKERKVQAHHDDYSKPLDVQWLCFECHRQVGHNQTVINKEFE